MKRLFVFEFRKIWFRKGFLIPITLIAVCLVWTIATGGKAYLSVLSGKERRANEETRPYWGQPITEEIRKTAKEKALLYGAEEVDGVLSLKQMEKQYGLQSEEYSLCLLWRSLYILPTLEEEQEHAEEILSALDAFHAQGIYSDGLYRSMIRGYENPAVYEIGPGSCAWRYWLDSEGYPSLTAGAATLGLIFLTLGSLFSREEGGGLGDLSLSKPRARQWIAAKVLAAASSGALIAFSLSFGMLLFYGLLYGFQGWNVSALTYAGSGWTYGIMYRPVTCLGLACIRLILFALSGAFLGLLTAACSALTRHALSSVGLASGICLIMESFLYLENAYRHSLANAPDAVRCAFDWGLLESFLLTPLRAFFNPEVLTSQTMGLESTYTGLMMYNTIMTTELASVFFGLMFAGMLCLTGLCFVYQKSR